MEYISVKEASGLWGIDVSNIGKLCRKGKIEGAKIVGRNWLIPKNAPKPIDGRTRTAKENQNATVFRFPLYVNFPEDSFVPPLSNEELRLRQAQVDFYACEFQKTKAVFEELAENAENIYVKICAQFYMCLLSAVYDINISWKQYYCSMLLLLSSDFPHKKETELLLPFLDFYFAQFINIPKKLNFDVPYEYHPTALYLRSFLSIFNLQEIDTDSSSLQYLEPYESLCSIMERDGYYIEAQNLHTILFVSYFAAHKEAAMQYHIRKAICIAYEHDLIYSVADAETYYTDEISAILNEYPDSFAERIRKAGKSIYDNYAQFTLNAEITKIYSKLSKNDYRFVTYALEGFTNRQVADFCNVSERTIAKKYNDIYDKLGVNSKQELVYEISTAFGKKK